MLKYGALTFELFEDFENFGSIGIRIPEQIKVPDDEREIVKKLSWRDLDWKEIGSDGRSIIWLQMSIPIDLDISSGVSVDIQLIQNTFYQVHINLAEDIRGIGLGTKIYRSLIDWAGHIYSGKGRRHNPIINDVLNKISSSIGVTCASNYLGDICISDNNPDKAKLIDLFKPDSYSKSSRGNIDI